MAENDSKNIATSENDERESQSQQDSTTFGEWIAASFGLILVVFALGTIFYRALNENSTPPILEVTVNSVKPSASGYLVQFYVKNTGTQTAANLTIEGELKKDGEPESEETSSATITYAPAHSQREGGLIFSKNPNDYRLELRAKGYEKP